MSQWKLIAGLGNPGNEYQRTRHNIGFMLLDYLVEHICAVGDDKMPRLRSGDTQAWRRKFDALMRDVWWGEERLWLTKPQSFMNLSGTSIAQALKFYQFGPEGLIVVHDDIDLPFGSLRIKSGGGDGGHKGIRSIVSSLGTPDFVRLKVGIGRPPSLAPRETCRTTADELAVTDWVLSPFAADEERQLASVLGRAVLALEEIYRSGVSRAQALYNTASVGPASGG